MGLAELLWTTLWLFFLFMFIWIFIALISDIFRDHEMSGWAKALWILVLVLFPLIGSLIYIIVRGPGMAQRSAAASERGQGRLRRLHPPDGGREWWRWRWRFEPGRRPPPAGDAA